MTGWLVLAGIALVVSYCGLIVLVQLFGEWAVNREAERTAAATFARDYIPDSAEVSAAEADIAENEMCALLDDAREHVERLVFAAECAEWEDAE